ncbi:serine hydrolase domain-containing protein [Daejeonella oryzae]|uniref:serine hydrolase domain-containing protein n=1 Tax=Daejeonella oryzae TaxID=1122943 RepID=UPI0003FFA5EF|nr:serine hydrolase [Daejeonella oryzae]
MYLVNKLMKLYVPFLAICIVQILSLTACAKNSDHRENEKKLFEDKVLERSTVLLNNQKKIVPLKNIEALKIASVNMGSVYSSVFDSLLNKYSSVSSFSATAYNSDSLTLDDLSDDLKFFNTVIIQLTDQSVKDPATIGFLLDNQRNKQIIICLNGDDKSLKLLDAINAPVIWTEKKSDEAAAYTAQLVFGGVSAKAKLKKNISQKYTDGSGFETSVTRLKYSVPEEVGINTSDLNPINDIVAEAIREKATPGAVVMVIKDGKVIFNKAYGSHTYAATIPTKITDIFDLASITKISATTMSVMHLYEQEKLKLDTNIGAYIPKARKNGKNEITVKEVMMHQAGFVPFIPFYKSIKSTDYQSDSSSAYPVKVADNYYLRKRYFEEVMWPQMLKSPVLTRGKYVYSDLSMYFMQDIVERQSGQRLENYVQKEFYQPLGMKTAGFNPRNRFSKDQIIPTENDIHFRKTLLEGYVHDQGAAMAGGVAGHAGLFATANDLAILYQMLLNRGSYGGQTYFRPQTVDLFTARQSPASRRGLGFDRWDPESKNGYPSKLASSETYGHTGYTGTCVWVDPKYNLVYIFLSNRVNPEVSDQLSKLNIRSRIQDVVYNSIIKSDIAGK